MRSKNVKVAVPLLAEAEEIAGKLGVPPSQVIDAGMLALRPLPPKEKQRLVREAFRVRRLPIPQSVTVASA
jgi:hypothetical protein